ncbi:CBPB1 Carboxypeptidase, partial [Mystacornis crossleyi]|nr:CBPB1 Carboxypeptidase [Mystacornis crossleyi]
MWALLVLIGAASVSAHLEDLSFDGQKVFRVIPQNDEQVEILKFLASTMEVDFWQPDSVTLLRPKMQVDFRIEAEKSFGVEDLLKESGMEYQVLIDNLQAALDAQFDSKARTASHGYEKYNNWDTIAAWTADIAAQNPDLVSRSVIGETFEGRPMYLLKVSVNFFTPDLSLINLCKITMSSKTPAMLIKAVETYGKDTVMTTLLDKLDFYVLPVVNIDGYIYTWTNVSTFFFLIVGRVNCLNLVLVFIYDSVTGPHSEKETKALADFIREHLSTIKAYLTIHSYSQLLLFPYSYTYDLPPDYQELVTYFISLPTDLAAGGSDDWAYDQGIKYAFTFELRDTGRYGFLLPESLIKPTCEETLLAVKYIANYVLEHLY